MKKIFLTFALAIETMYANSQVITELRATGKIC